MYPASTLVTSQPRKKAVRATARTAAFISGASPPLVRTATLMWSLLSLLGRAARNGVRHYEQNAIKTQVFAEDA